MPAIPSSLHHLKPLFFSLPRFSSPSLTLNRVRKFPIPTINPRSLSSLSSAVAAAEQSTDDNGGGGGRSDALAPPPITEELQKIDVNPPKGTRDLPPEEMRLRTWLFHNFREVSRLFGFEEVDFPVFESEALYIRKAGKEIRDQLYCFEDRGNRRVALRPELTP
ncbi:histidine--tRNA ligase, chloroplastic/mitochondrial-like [Quercus lobata]|uniref:histidine--tRNA ligase n=1 Tax=Quercus lobata TaxID=97700 RepID=A0A7N2M700_QUELO|nr:histidine--tRNA ligase, chloroplastic/mitochondrial-like [Quercus lobata]